MAYIGKEPGSGLRGRFVYTATAGQTSFTGSDSLGRTLTYTDSEYTDVFLNGVKLDKTDYTATSGTSIVLDSGASADDTLEILAFDTFGLFSGEFAQDVSVGGDLTISDKIIHSGDTNTTIRFADADTVTVETGGSERMRITSGGNIQIGSTNSGVAGSIDVSIGSTSSSGGITLFSPTNGTHSIGFADGTSGTDRYRGYIEYQHANDAMAFATQSTERLRIQSGGGISFNGDTAAVNALDDYEEGTFTPIFVQAGSAISGCTTSINSGKYTKVGNVCTVEIYLKSTAAGSTSASSHLGVGGLPFTAANTANVLPSVSVGYRANFNTANPTHGIVQTNQDYINLYTLASADARTNSATMIGTYLGSDTYLILNATYLTN